MVNDDVGKVFKRKDAKSLSLLLEEYIYNEKVVAPESFKKTIAEYDLNQMGDSLVQTYRDVIG